jgi:hypothetical protein
VTGAASRPSSPKCPRANVVITCGMCPTSSVITTTTTGMKRARPVSSLRRAHERLYLSFCRSRTGLEKHRDGWMRSKRGLPTPPPPCPRSSYGRGNPSLRVGLSSCRARSIDASWTEEKRRCRTPRCRRRKICFLGLPPLLYLPPFRGRRDTTEAPRRRRSTDPRSPPSPRVAAPASPAMLRPHGLTSFYFSRLLLHSERAGGCCMVTASAAACNRLRRHRRAH